MASADQPQPTLLLCHAERQGGGPHNHMPLLWPAAASAHQLCAELARRDNLSKPLTKRHRNADAELTQRDSH